LRRGVFGIGTAADFCIGAVRRWLAVVAVIQQRPGARGGRHFRGVVLGGRRVVIGHVRFDIHKSPGHQRAEQPQQTQHGTLLFSDHSHGSLPAVSEASRR